MCDQSVYLVEKDNERLVMSSVEKIKAENGVFYLTDIFGEEKRVENAVFSLMDQNRFYLRAVG
jgi:hypothetical protein